MGLMDYRGMGRGNANASTAKLPPPAAPVPQTPPQGVVQRAATLVPVPTPAPAPQAAPQQSVVSRGQRLMAMGLVSPQGLAISEATGLDPLTAESHIKRTPGQAAITREQLLASNEQAVAMKQARQEVSRNAWDQGDLDEKEARDLLALETRKETEATKVQGALDVAAAQEAEMARQYGTSKEEIDAWEARLTGEEKQLISELDDIANQKADPTRLFVQRGALGTALSTIGDALTTYAEFRAGRPLTRQLQQDIDRDIAIQEQEIARKGEGKRTELAQLSRQFGSLEAGKAALRAKQEAYAATQLARASLVAEEPAIRAEIEAASQEAWNRVQDNLVLAKMGDRTVSESSAYASPRAGYAGSTRYDIPGLAEDVSKLGPGGVEPKQLEDYGKAVEGPNKMVGGIDALVARFPESLALTPEGRVKATGDIPGSGMWDERKPAILKSEKDIEFEAAADELIDIIAKSGGGVMTESDIERAKNRLGSGSERERVAALSELRQAALRARTDAAGRFDPRVRQAYELQRMPFEQRQTRELEKARAEDQLAQTGEKAKANRKPGGN